jgi:hypothetical protein
MLGYVSSSKNQIAPNFLGIYLLALFCKLDNFINITNISCIAMKRSSLQKELIVNWCRKSFVRLTAGLIKIDIS